MLNKLLMMAAGLGMSFGFAERTRRLSTKPRRTRETARAAWQGLHNTPDGRIERRKGVEVWFGHPFGYGCASSHENKWPPKNIGYGDTRAEAIRDYRNSFFHPETKA